MKAINNMCRNLRLYRKLMGMTKKEFAERLGVAPRTYASFEKDGIKMISHLMKIELVTRIKFNAWRSQLTINDMKQLIREVDRRA